MVVMLPGSTNPGLLIHTGSGRSMMETFGIVMMIIGGIALLVSFGFLFFICALYAWMNSTEEK
jgi:hypothetical protein